MKLSLPEIDLQHIWTKAHSCLAHLKNSRIFITGGTGFFGSWLLESVCYANKVYGTNIKLVVLSRDVRAFIKKSPQFSNLSFIDFIEGNIIDFTFPKSNFTHIIHAATSTNAFSNQNNPLSMLDTIILGTRRLLEFAVATKAGHILMTSSGAIYGRQPPTLEKIPESYISQINSLNKNSAYAFGKLASEHLSVHYNLNIKIARCFAFIGPYLPLTTHFAIGNFVANALNNESIYILGDGTPYRSYLYAADLVIWLWTILCFGSAHSVYNVGSEESINIAELAQLIAGQIEPKLKINRIKEPKLEIPAERYVPDTQKARNELNLQQWITLEDAINRTLTWHTTYSHTS